MSEPKPHRSRILKWALIAGGLVLLLAALGTAALLYGWTHFSRALPPLKGWHLQAPASEFTAAKAGFKLDDYLALEDKVFDELKALVEGPWAEEAQSKFSRFQPASVCNPVTLLERNWNRTFVLEPANTVGGALLLHGLSDAPYSLRAMGARLQAEGFVVVGLRVPGHGTCPAALAKVSRDDWIAAVRVAAAGVRARIPKDAPFILVGYSNGGALSVNHALESLDDSAFMKPDAILLLSPMLGINPMAPITRFHRFIAAASGVRRANWSSIQAEIDPYKYSSWPMNASVQAWKMTAQVEERLAAIEKAGRMNELPPILAFQSAVDATVVVPRLIEELFDRVVSNGSELVLFDVNRAGWLRNLLSLKFEKKIQPLLPPSNPAFALTRVTNASEDSLQLVARTHFEKRVTEQPLDIAWPAGVFSLSHVAVPIPDDDPVYGTAEATAGTGLHLGTLNMHGENGVLEVSSSLAVRMRHNPFYKFAEDRAVEWLKKVLEMKGQSSPL